MARGSMRLRFTIYVYAFTYKHKYAIRLPPRSLLRPLALKSLLLALVFLLRFQALRSCGTAATILAEFSGALAAGSLSSAADHHFYPGKGGRRARRLRGFAALAVALVLLCHGWDRIGCSPLSSSRVRSSLADAGGGGAGCIRILPMLLPFLSGFLGFYDRSSTNWIQLRQLARRRLRLLSLGMTTALLFFPAFVSFIISEAEKDVSVGKLGWSLLNTVVFGVILSGNLGDDKVMPGSKDFHREFLVTFSCTLVLELFYSPHLSLPGFLFCGFLLWISVNQLASSSSNWLELGSSDTSESLYSMVMKPVHHILSERKSRKIALFLLINTAYMVVEFVAGFVSNSLGLISDACHMLFDCAALAIGLYASYISRLPANAHFTYGRGRFEVLSGYVNAVFLVLVGALIVLESLERILDPQEISTNSLLTVSIGGLVVNVVGLVFFHEEHHHAHGGGSCSHTHHAHDDGSCSHTHRAHDDGSCSHSHSALDMDHHCNHHHHHEEHQHHHVNVVHQQTSDNGRQSSIFIDHGSLDMKSYDDKNQHCCDHENHHHSHNGVHISDSKGRMDISERDHCHHDHQHDQCHHDHQHDHCHHDQHDHSHHIEGCLSVNHNEVKGLLPAVGDTSMRLSGNHHHGENNVDCSKGSIHKNCHIDKGHQGHSHTSGPCQILSHDHSHQSNGSLTEGKLLEKPHKHRHIDHNMEGIFLHVLADTMGSVGVVISTLLIKYKGWLVADPASSIFISVMIISSVVPLLRNSAEILLQRVPRPHEQEIKEALDDVTKIHGVCSVHNMHVWNFTNTDIVGTLHLHVCADSDKVSIKKEVSQRLHEAGVKDLTVQMEYHMIGFPPPLSLPRTEHLDGQLGVPSLVADDQMRSLFGGWVMAAAWCSLGWREGGGRQDDPSLCDSPFLRCSLVK
ncbi:hypothetical protein Taro_031057 [Colocasia esculenta]|uniref:Cation efflux protein transmembrane domain-containing protein n=1 Tax=Colocasia esculenta TaxID=4460 RepID=A0A843VQV7_COLES|nr:hypothetical protein [Colocasia esculenta]